MKNKKLSRTEGTGDGRDGRDGRDEAITEMRGQHEQLWKICDNDMRIIIIIHTSSTDCYASGADAPYGYRHVVPSAASIAGV